MVASRKRPFVFDSEALAEAIAATRWYRERDPRVADRFLAEMRHHVDRARLMFESYPPYLHGTRKAAISRFPYLLVMMEWQGEIKIVAVAHTSRRPGYWQERLDDEI